MCLILIKYRMFRVFEASYYSMDIVLLYLYVFPVLLSYS